MRIRSMPRLKQTAAALAASTLFVPLVALVSSPAWAEGCHIWAGKPTTNVKDVTGPGGRSGCSSTTTLYVRLKWDKPLQPDPTISSRSGQYRNVTLNPWGKCLAGKHGYYVETTGGGSKQLSERNNYRCP